MFTPETGSAAGKVGGSKPKKRDFLTQQIISELNELRGDEPTKARRLVIALIDKAMDGDVPAAREVLDRVEGKVALPMEHGGTLLEELLDRLAGTARDPSSSEE